jgi:hypothetical protein
MFTDTEAGMALGFAKRIRSESDYAQSLINQIHRELEMERAARRRAETALNQAHGVIADLQAHIAEIDAVLAGG